MPFTNFEKLKTPEEILLFFEKHFADAISLIGEKRLIDDFRKTKPQHLVSVKVQGMNETVYEMLRNLILVSSIPH